MAKDIVPRAFACDYTLVADLLKRVSDSFREHRCLSASRTVGGRLGRGGAEQAGGFRLHALLTRHRAPVVAVWPGTVLRSHVLLAVNPLHFDCSAGHV